MCIELTCHVAVLLHRDMVAHRLRVRVAPTLGGVAPRGAAVGTERVLTQK